MGSSLSVCVVPLLSGCSASVRGNLSFVETRPVASSFVV